MVSSPSFMKNMTVIIDDYVNVVLADLNMCHREYKQSIKDKFYTLLNNIALYSKDIGLYSVVIQGYTPEDGDHISEIHLIDTKDFSNNVNVPENNLSTEDQLILERVFWSLDEHYIRSIYGTNYRVILYFKDNEFTLYRENYDKEKT